MSRLLFVLLLASCAEAWAQNSSSPSNSSQSQSHSSTPDSASDSKAQKPRNPNLTPPRSDRVRADELSDEPGESSSKDTQIDLSPPEDDAKAHPQSTEALMDAEGTPADADVREFHPWDPHRAAKNVEVGDYYFKGKNYVAAESRYREALLYKDNDAIATFRLAVCLEKLNRPDEARQEYESYLKILPHGPQAADATKAISRLKGTTANAK